ncbi:MAG: family 43 glycosylhydrolase [Muribaculaceae bacterium]|nr:family 43 glycosylhydrolase [Muribaculaceae bacterium]
MKKLIISTIIFGVVTAVNAATAQFDNFSYTGLDSIYASPLTEPGEYYNPVISGWASDPSVVGRDGDYWLVTSTFGYFPGVPIYHSRDLMTWTQVGNVLSRPEQLPWLQGVSLGKGGIYAPAISYNPANGLFYMITTCVNGNESINFYVTATDPTGQWSDPVVLPDVHGIDPSFFFDDDGKAYIVHKADEHSPVKWSNYRALAIIEFDTSTGKTVGEPVLFKEEGVGPEEQLERNEGPHIYKINSKYYLIAAEGGTSWCHSEVCYKADNIYGPWRRWSRGPMLTQRLQKTNRPLPVTCAGHADLVEKDGRWLAVFLGCRPWSEGSEHLGRETFMMPVRWSADSFPYITQNLDLVPIKTNIPATETQQPGQAGNFTWTDTFRSPSLDPGWISLWGSPAEMVTVGDGLVMQCAPVDTRSGITPAYVGRRMQHHDFEVTTTVTLSRDAKDTDAAGLLLVKSEQRQLFLAVTPTGISLMKPGGKVVASVDLKTLGRPVELRAESRDGNHIFSYRIADSRPGDFITLDAVSRDWLQSSSGGFTGSTIGLFATSAPF